MEKELLKAFHKAKESNPSLATDIWRKLVIRNKRIAIVKLWAFSIVGFFSLMGLIPAWKALSTDLSQSGFYEYFSILFSNGWSITSYWRESIMSIAQSLPTMSILISLSLVFIFLLSLKFIAKQIIKSQLSVTGFSALSF